MGLKQCLVHGKPSVSVSQSSRDSRMRNGRLGLLKLKYEVYLCGRWWKTAR